MAVDDQVMRERLWVEDAPEKCSPQERARRGGIAISEDRAWMQEIGRRGGLKVSEDREHMSQIGQLGAQARLAKRESHHG